MRSTIRAFALVALLPAASLLGACAPMADSAATPAPTMPPSLSAAHHAEEDIAAAKQAYLDYIEAINGMDLTSRETIEKSMGFATGDRLRSDREAYAFLSDQGWVASGESRVLSMTYLSEGSTADTVRLHTCLDVSQLFYADARGPIRNPDWAAFPIETVMVISLMPDGRWLVSGLQKWTGEPSCPDATMAPPGEDGPLTPKAPRSPPTTLQPWTSATECGGLSSDRSTPPRLGSPSASTRPALGW